MALPMIYTPPKDKAELERRKVLAEQLKEFVQKPDSSPNTPESLMAEAGRVGVSKDQMSSLYKQYAPATTPAPTTAKPSMFAEQEVEARERSAASGAFGGVNQNPSMSTGPATRLLDRYDAMQGSGSPMGSASTLSQTRSLGSETGKASRMERKLRGMGYSAAAEKMALGAATTGLDEPKIKSQEFRGLEEQAKTAATNEAAANAAQKRKQFELQNKLLDQQNKDLTSGMFDYRKYAPSS
jgi:hypothetical protein